MMATATATAEEEQKRGHKCCKRKTKLGMHSGFPKEGM
jgi:hypothetical protein